MLGLKRDSLVRSIVLFILFSSTCFTLGYAALNRYDPRDTGVRDCSTYCNMVTYDYEKVGAPYRFRVLIPTIASLFHSQFSKLDFRTWDTVVLSMLVTNSIITALTCLMIMEIARSIVPNNRMVPLLSTFVFLTSFSVVNTQLVALIDPGETFAITAMILTTVKRQWWLLPFVMVIGVMFKETSLVFQSVFLVSWLIINAMEKKKISRSSIFFVLLAIILGPITRSIVQAIVGGDVYDMHQFSLQRILEIPEYMIKELFSKSMFYSFVILIPLALPRIRRLPRELVLSAAITGCVAVILASYAQIEGNGSRALFNIVSPLCVISGAYFLSDLVTDTAGRSQTTSS